MKLSDEVLQAHERALVRLVLVTICDATPVLGRPPSPAFVAAVLVGSTGTNIKRTDGDRIPSYGTCEGTSVSRVHQWLSLLETAGLMERIKGGTLRGGLVLTGPGRAAVEGNWPVGLRVGLIPRTVDPAALDLAVRTGLVDALRRYAESTPAAQLAETVIRQIATLKHPTFAALDALVLRDFTHEILRIIEEHKPVLMRLTNAALGS